MPIDDDYKESLRSAQKSLDRKHREELQHKRLQEQREQRQRELDEKINHDNIVIDRKERLAKELLDIKYRREDVVIQEDRISAEKIEIIKGENAKSQYAVEADIDMQKQRLNQTFLDLESDRKIFEEHNKAKDHAMADIMRIMVQESEKRKTLSHQAKLAQQGVDKDKIQGWIEDENKSEEDK